MQLTRPQVASLIVGIRDSTRRHFDQSMRTSVARLSLSHALTLGLFDLRRHDLLDERRVPARLGAN